MKENRNAVIKIILGYEGGYVDNPHDPGGATNHGITITDYRKFVKPDATKEDVKAMPEDQAIGIYANKYWHFIMGDDLYWGIDLVVMDAAVNSGIGRADRWLRQALKFNDVSSPIDQSVIGVMMSEVRQGGGAQLIRDFCDRRLSFLEALKTWQFFGKGWMKRVCDGRARALVMIATGAGHAVSLLTMESLNAQTGAGEAKTAKMAFGAVAAVATASAAIPGDGNMTVSAATVAAVAAVSAVYHHWQHKKHTAIDEAAKTVLAEHTGAKDGLDKAH